ncbi:uncharacterized protein LOC135931174 [Gordionus sp. m RMFG-2023]|uniref:uncharacterized protein LOC135931174 n=1 Tax=Gordionus sp. m RMFG-2023 TaxID=3053472 RepID=UPI0031FDBF58
MNAQNVEAMHQDDNDSSDSINNISQIGRNRAKISVRMNGVPIEFDYDTGAQVSVIGKQYWDEIGRPKLGPTKPLSVYGNQPLDVLGETVVRVRLEKISRSLPIVVTRSNDIPLFGLPWILAFNMFIPRQVTICSITSKEVMTTDKQIAGMTKEFFSVFDDKPGRVKDMEVSIHLSKAKIMASS